MLGVPLNRKSECCPSVIHHIVCQHQIEVEVWPAAAEVYFSDHPFVDPINTQVRFNATVYNAPSDRVSWMVTDIGGGPGAGSIDPSGLYTAPPKGTFPNGLTDIIVATSVDEPFRKAYAQVTLIGKDPESVIPDIEIYPKQIYLYYPEGHNNEYIDKSNKMQLFRANIRNSSSTNVVWKRDGAIIPAWHKTWYLYRVKDWSTIGGTSTVKLTAELSSGEKAEAIIIMINYVWPGT